VRRETFGPAGSGQLQEARLIAGRATRPLELRGAWTLAGAVANIVVVLSFPAAALPPEPVRHDETRRSAIPALGP
jgi:hypothetical protein